MMSCIPLCGLHACKIKKNEKRKSGTVFPLFAYNEIYSKREAASRKGGRGKPSVCDDETVSVMVRFRWPKQKRKRLEALCNVALQRRETADAYSINSWDKDITYVFNEEV